jgi:hypothetical protein
MNLTSTISTALDSLKRIVTKISRYGAATQGIQVAPFGIDSNPIAKLLAVYAETDNQGQPIILGYVNVNSLAAAGETRIFSTDADNNLKAQVWCLANGKVQMNDGSHPAVLGDSNKTALTDMYNMGVAMQAFATACESSTTDPTLATAATTLANYLSSALPQLQTDINATNSNNVTLN